MRNFATLLSRLLGVLFTTHRDSLAYYLRVAYYCKTGLEALVNTRYKTVHYHRTVFILSMMRCELFRRLLIMNKTLNILL